MSDLVIRYELTGSGWASATLSSGGEPVVMTASYLHDSLQQLAAATIALSNGAPTATVIFMDEPAEHHLELLSGERVPRPTSATRRKKRRR